MLFPSQRVCNLSRCGAACKRNLVDNGSAFEQRFYIPVQGKAVEEGAMSMTDIPTQSGFMRLEDSEKLLRAIFPQYPSLEPRYPAPALEQIPQGRADRSN